MPDDRDDRGNWRPIRNDYSGEAPAGSIGKVTGFDDTGDALTITRPDADNLSNIIIIGYDLPGGGTYGIGWESGTHPVEFGGSTPSVDDRLGTVTDSWEPEVSDEGVLIVRGVDGSTAFVQPAPGGGGTIGLMIKAKEDMVTDDTEYDAVYVLPDGTEGVALTVRRPNNVLVEEDHIGFLGTTTEGEDMFIDAHNWPTNPTPDVDFLGFGTEGPEAADTNDYDYSATDNGLVFTYMTRVAYYDAGDETLYGYVREMTFDKKGHLVSVSSESRIIIDVPGTCP